MGDRIGALTVWGADAERVCVPEAGAVEVPEDLDPAEVAEPRLSLHDRLPGAAPHGEGEARARRCSCTARPAGWASPLSSWERRPGFALFGTASARDRAEVERLGAVAIDYRNEDFLARVRELTGRRRGRRRSTASAGRSRCARSARCGPAGGWSSSAATARSRTGRKTGGRWSSGTRRPRPSGLWGKLSPRRRVFAYRVQKFRDKATEARRSGRRRAADPEWFREDFGVLLELLREGRIHPVVAERLPLAERRHAHELLESSAAKGKLVLVP